MKKFFCIFIFLTVINFLVLSEEDCLTDHNIAVFYPMDYEEIYTAFGNFFKKDSK